MILGSWRKKVLIWFWDTSEQPSLVVPGLSYVEWAVWTDCLLSLIPFLKSIHFWKTRYIHVQKKMSFVLFLLLLSCPWLSHVFETVTCGGAHTPALEGFNFYNSMENKFQKLIFSWYKLMTFSWLLFSSVERISLWDFYTASISKEDYFFLFPQVRKKKYSRHKITDENISQGPEIFSSMQFWASPKSYLRTQ